MSANCKVQSSCSWTGMARCTFYVTTSCWRAVNCHGFRNSVCCKPLLYCSRHYQTHSQASKMDLTPSEALKALRPFYLAVHPDRFTKFPQERAANEESLKRLNSYLDSLGKQERSNGASGAHVFTVKKWPKPIKLKFFIHSKVKQTRAANELTAVGISLDASSIGSAIHDILESCDLSVHVNHTTKTKLTKIKSSDHLKHILSMYYQSKPSVSSSVPLSQQVYNYPDFEGAFENTNSTHHQPLQVDKWFLRNLPLARANLAASEPLRKHNERFIKELCSCRGIQAVVAEQEWTAATLRRHLTMLKELLVNEEVVSMREEYGSNFAVHLGYMSDVDLNGCVYLNCEHTFQQWIKFLTSAKTEFATLKESGRLENELSLHLRFQGKLKRPIGVSSDTYQQWLVGLLQECKGQPSTSPNFSDICSSTTVMLQPTNVPSIAEDGTVLFSPMCSVYQLLDFLQKHHREINQRKDAHRRSKMELEIALEECKRSLKLSVLTRKPTITDKEVYQGCKQLLKLSEKSELNLAGLHVCLCTYFAVSSDGLVKIPWNFKLP